MLCPLQANVYKPSGQSSLLSVVMKGHLPKHSAPFHPQTFSTPNRWPTSTNQLSLSSSDHISEELEVISERPFHCVSSWKLYSGNLQGLLFFRRSISERSVRNSVFSLYPSLKLNLNKTCKSVNGRKLLGAKCVDTSWKLFISALTYSEKNQNSWCVFVCLWVRAKKMGFSSLLYIICFSVLCKSDCPCWSGGIPLFLSLVACFEIMTYVKVEHRIKVSRDFRNGLTFSPRT